MRTLEKSFPFPRFQLTILPVGVLAQKNRSQSFYVYNYFPFMQKKKKKSLKKKKKAGQQEITLKASNIELMVLDGIKY